MRRPPEDKNLPGAWPWLRGPATTCRRTGHWPFGFRSRPENNLENHRRRPPVVVMRAPRLALRAGHASACSRNTAFSATTPQACTHASRLSRVAVIPPTNGAMTRSGTGPRNVPLALPADSLLSSSWRLLWSRSCGPSVLANPIPRPTREPPLLSSQIQQGPGHPPIGQMVASARLISISRSPRTLTASGANRPPTATPPGNGP